VLGWEVASASDGPATTAVEADDGATSASLPATSAAGTSAGEGSEQDGNAERRRPSKGHGRHGASAYTGCAKVAVPLSWLHPGDACPSCDGGKVYGNVAPRRLVRLVGQAPVEIVLGKNSGLDSIRLWLERLGMTASEEQMQAMLLQVKDRSIKNKALLSVDEFRNIAQSATG